jgi:16S rRNA (cytosine1402-N4)-methyltransferase
MHIPVLLNEVLEYLNPKPNENFVDCTVGQGGHTKLILEKITPNGKVLGIDLDEKQIDSCKLLKEKYGERLILVNDNYANLKDIINKNNFNKVNGILADIGFSSFQTDESKKGFSFQRNEPLDMRYNLDKNNLTAKIILNEWTEKEIEKILEDYGEEKFSKQIACEIVKQRKIIEISTTFQLVEIIKKAIPLKFQYGRIHYATKTFQAIRIVVNGELENLKKVLSQAFSVLENGGRLAIISFHSLEDRIVKNYFKEELEKGTIKILTKKPIKASDQEVELNPRSRSAKLRAIIKL